MQKYKEFQSWDSRYKGNYDVDELRVHDYLYNNIYAEQDTGLFIDIGANDGVTISHSLPFIDKGWSAIMVEPHPVLFDKMRNLYSHLPDVKCLNLAVAPEKKEGVVFFVGKHKHSGHGTILKSESEHEWAKQFFSGETILVNTDTLTNVLKENEARMIDILHLDTEGKSLDILKSFDFALIRPRFISVDILTQDFDPLGPHLKSFMEEINYKFLFSQGQSLWEDSLVFSSTNERVNRILKGESI